MKVITEEGLRYVLKMHFGSDDVNQSICSHLINECQETDTLTVSKLRNMSDAPRADGFLVKLRIESAMHESWYLPSGLIQVGTLTFKESFAEGWIPMPIYKPEEPTKEMIWPDACG